MPWLLALGTWRATPWVLPVMAVSVAVITCLQIIPEERVLAERFGREWQDWSSRVRRWIRAGRPGHPREPWG